MAAQARCSPVDTGEVILVAAPGLLDELGEVLGRDRFRTWVSMEQVEAYVVAIRHRVELVHDPAPAEVRPVSRDPDDDYLIALARATGVDVLVTGDEDLTSLELDDLEILTPRQVLDRLS